MQAAGGDLRGDGTVLHSCSVLPGTRTYLARGTEHSQLANSPAVIGAVLAILAGQAVDLPDYPSDPGVLAPPWPPQSP
jgi:hypothetical protein